MPIPEAISCLVGLRMDSRIRIRIRTHERILPSRFDGVIIPNDIACISHSQSQKTVVSGHQTPHVQRGNYADLVGERDRLL